MKLYVPFIYCSKWHDKNYFVCLGIFHKKEWAEQVLATKVIDLFNKSPRPFCMETADNGRQLVKKYESLGYIYKKYEVPTTMHQYIPTKEPCNLVGQFLGDYYYFQISKTTYNELELLRKITKDIGPINNCFVNEFSLDTIHEMSIKLN